MLILDIDKSRKKNLCEDVICWFVSKYLSRFNIEIIVEHKNLKQEGFWGYCGIVDSTYRARVFLIEIDPNLRYKSYVTTLLHECQHIYQHCKGHLKIKGNKQLWKGKDLSSTPYDVQEHEIEANYMENVLFLEYTEYLEGGGGVDKI